MKNKIKRMKIMIIRKIALLLFITLMSSPVWALTTGGTPIIAIDGNLDTGVTVDIQSNLAPGYIYGYYLNGGVFTELFPVAPGLPVNFTTFTGGDVIDFALYDGTRYYTLSGDAADSSYSVLMTFLTQVTVGAAQQPAGWTLPYYNNANITWSLPTNVNTNELALNFTNGNNDGIAPVSVPEPSTLLLLGSGLAGLGFFGRNRRKKA